MHCRQAFYLFIMKTTGNEVLKKKSLLLLTMVNGEKFRVYTPHSGPESLVLCKKKKKKKRKATHSVQLHWIEQKKKENIKSEENEI